MHQIYISIPWAHLLNNSKHIYIYIYIYIYKLADAYSFEIC